MSIPALTGVTLDEAYKISQIVVAAASILTGFVTLAILCITYRLTKSCKRAEVIAHCNSRFEDIMHLRHDPRVRKDPMIFYRRFWALQFDQFTYWLHGFVSDDIFSYWMRERHDAWISNQELYGIDYKTGWTQAIVGWTYTEFIDFMNIVHEHTAEEAIAKFGCARRLHIFPKRRQLK